MTEGTQGAIITMAGDAPAAAVPSGGTIIVTGPLGDAMLATGTLGATTTIAEPLLVSSVYTHKECLYLRKI